jgi:hypothetical protein
VTWSQASPDFEPDGGLRDIYVRNVGPSGWENVYHWLLDTYPHVFLRDAVEVEPPPSVQFIWEDRKIASSLLTLRVADLRVNCHFFQSDDLELDIRPEEVDEEQIRGVRHLMLSLGRLAGRQAGRSF